MLSANMLKYTHENRYTYMYVMVFITGKYLVSTSVSLVSYTEDITLTRAITGVITVGIVITLGLWELAIF